MADILHQIHIAASPEAVFAAISTPEGLDGWWTLSCEGSAEPGAEYALGFGPGYDWTAVVTACEPGALFELQLRDADPDWVGTRVGFALQPTEDGTSLRFHHLGWADPGEHHRVSTTCWALYLRLAKRLVEHGERVPYAQRLEA
jgi:uncharacterized protein YndB with AHSA1/START domain